MSCCGLFKTKGKAKLSPQQSLQQSHIVTVESERSIYVRKATISKTLPEKVPKFDFLTSHRKLTTMERVHERDEDLGNEGEEQTNKPAYCLNVPWKPAKIDRTKATPFHIYSPGENRRF